MTDQRYFYKLQKNAPLPWFNKSSDLRASAAALWTSCEKERSDSIVNECRLGEGFIMAAAVDPVYLMLCGMSLELLYKAIVVAKGGNPEPSHDLINLIKPTGISVDKDKERLLKILTEAIKWYGRYPVPKSHEPMNELSNNIDEYFYEKLSQGGLKTERSNKSFRWDTFNALWLEGSRLFHECHFQPCTPPDTTESYW